VSFINVILMFVNNFKKQDFVSKWWFCKNQKKEKHFFEDVNSIY
jgi:hypothetical protein